MTPEQLDLLVRRANDAGCTSIAEYAQRLEDGYDRTLPAGARTDDFSRAEVLLGGLCQTHEIHAVAFDGEPLSKSRARFGKHHRVYTPAATQKAEDAMAGRLGDIPTFTGNVAVACVFYRSKRQRIDVDNLLKLVLDAATKAGVWEDDSQVTALVGVLEYDAEHPRTTIAFGHHVSSMTRGEDSLSACIACGKRFNAYGVASRRHCSVACRMKLAEPVVCPGCDRKFKRRSSRQKYCSVECRGRAKRADRRCSTCGARTSKTGYGQCRDCWLAESQNRQLEPCSVHGCGREQYALGLCNSHYQASRRKSPTQITEARSTA